MIVIESDQGAFFDVDETLVMMDDRDIRDEAILIIDEEDNIRAIATPHWEHVQKIKDHYSRGHKIFIWSGGGYKWATAVVRALHLEPYVTAIIPKGPWIWDDKEPSEFLKRSYIEYKK